MQAIFSKTDAGKKLWAKLEQSERKIFFVDNSKYRTGSDEDKNLHNAMIDGRYTTNAETMSEAEYEAARQGIKYSAVNSTTFNESTGLYDKNSEFDNTYIVFDKYGASMVEVVTDAKINAGVMVEGNLGELALILIVGEEAFHALQNSFEFYKRTYDPKTKKYIENKSETNLVPYEKRSHEIEARKVALGIFLDRINQYMKDNPGKITITITQ